MAVNKTKLKKQIFDIIQIGDKSNLASRAFDIFIVGVILSNISVMFLQTYDQLEPYYGLLSVIEWVTTGIFSAYGRRISCIPHAPEERL